MSLPVLFHISAYNVLKKLTTSLGCFAIVSD